MVRKEDLLQTTMFEEDPQKSILSKSKVHAERRDFFFKKQTLFIRHSVLNIFFFKNQTLSNILFNTKSKSGL